MLISSLLTRFSIVSTTLFIFGFSSSQVFPSSYSYTYSGPNQIILLQANKQTNLPLIHCTYIEVHFHLLLDFQTSSKGRGFFSAVRLAVALASTLELAHFGHDVQTARFLCFVLIFKLLAHIWALLCEILPLCLCRY